MFWRLSLLLVVAVATVTPIRAASGHPVGFKAPDGRTVSGLLFEADQKPAAAVVLVPMLGRPKEDWQAVGQRLSESNITALAIDLPANILPDDPGRNTAGWPGDVTAAVGFLAAQPQVRPTAIGIAGASLGASMAALAAAGDARVRSIALISPSLDYRGIQIQGAMRQYGSRPALLIASTHDPYALRSAHELADKPPGIREVRPSEAAAHGTLLLTQDADLVRGLIEWFQRTLG